MFFQEVFKINIWNSEKIPKPSKKQQKYKKIVRGFYIFFVRVIVFKLQEKQKVSSLLYNLTGSSFHFWKYHLLTVKLSHD